MEVDVQSLSNSTDARVYATGATRACCRIAREAFSPVPDSQCSERMMAGMAMSRRHGHRLRQSSLFRKSRDGRGPQGRVKPCAEAGPVLTPIQGWDTGEKHGTLWGAPWHTPP